MKKENTAVYQVLDKKDSNKNMDEQNQKKHQKIIEYENKNQYNFQNFKNNFTYIKKSTGNNSFRSFNKSLKTKINMNNSLNNTINRKNSALNNSEKKIIGIYSRPNNYIENMEKEEKIPKPNEINKKDKIQNLNNNKGKNLTNEYLYKYNEKKKDDVIEDENDDYEDYEVSSENEQKVAQNKINNNSTINNNINMVYNRKTSLMKKDMPKNLNNNNININNSINQNKIIITNEEKPKYNIISKYINKKEEQHEDEKEEEEEEEEEEEDEEEEDEEEEEIEEEQENKKDGESKSREIIEEKRQFKKKDKQRQSLDEEKKNKSNNNEIDNENNSEASSQEEEEEDEDGVEPEYTSDEIYILELEESGSPILKNNEILTLNANSYINISLNLGNELSKDICLITNCENDFPDPFYLNKIIDEVNAKNKDKVA